MEINRYIFREYDIRGVTGEEFSPEEIAKYEKWYGSFPGITLPPEAALAIGKAYGTIIRQSGGKRVLVGYELRPFGERLQKSFVDGLRSTGCEVLDAGISLTPIIYFATAFLGFDGGVNVTGSHNVYFYNGFKMVKKDAWPLFGQEIKAMQEMIQKEDFIADRRGNYEEFNGYEVYQNYFLSHLTLSRRLHIVIDTGNGSAGVFAPQLFRDLGCEVVELHTEPDATFPNHTPDPEAPQNMKDLGEKVRETKADLGIGFDADGDRVGFVNEKGEFVSADLILLVFAKDVLSRNRGKKILYDVKCSQLLGELIPPYGGVPLMHRTGHAPIKETLRRDSEIILGGEVSGHFYFVEDYFKIDDGLFAAGKMLELFSKTSARFSSLFEGIPSRIRTPEMKLPCGDEEKFQIVEQIKTNLQKRFPAVVLDGIRIQVADAAWGLVRASNTSPYLTLRFEGQTEEEVVAVKNILADELEKFPEVTDKLNRSHVAVLEGKLGWI